MRIVRLVSGRLPLVAAVISLSCTSSLVSAHAYKPQSCAEQLANARADASLAKPDLRFHEVHRDKVAAWDHQLVHCPKGEISLRNHDISPQCRTDGSGFIPSYDPAPLATAESLAIPSEIIWFRFLHSCNTVLIGY